MTLSNQCFHDNHDDCEPCDCECHIPKCNVTITHENQFTQEELASLYKFLEKQYLPYDDLFLHETVRKLGKLVTPAQK